MWQCCGAVEAGETVSLVWAEPGAASVSPAFSPCVCSKPFKSGLLPVFEGVLVRFLCFFSLYLFVFFSCCFHQQAVRMSVSVFVNLFLKLF